MERGFGRQGQPADDEALPLLAAAKIIDVLQLAAALKGLGVDALEAGRQCDGVQRRTKRKSAAGLWLQHL